MIVNVLSDTTYVKISWIFNSEPDLIGYDIYVSNDKEPIKFNKLNSKPVLADFFETEIKNTGDYKFYIVAIDSVGNISENSDTLDCAVLLPDNISQELKISSAVFYSDKNTAVISWNKLENIEGYIVFRRDEDEDLSESISELISGNTFEDINSEKEKYFYSVRAIDKEGNLYISDEVIPQIK